ncbi:GAF domain-containing protein [Bacillus sp. 37MA]|uniref:GAF domain-containing protein n=1 Tax=Bacillus sp. 37MA TaxID=1132442 RepID=UPI000376065F|nr:GAF domain-containing protein [Bacillus sp. 37MA]
MEKLKKPLIFITIIYALIYYLFILFWSTNTLGMGIVAVTGPIIALIFLGVAIYHIKELEEKRFWFIIFAACFSYFIGEFMWVAMDFPFPSWANFFFNMFVILYSLAILYKVYMKRRQYGSIQLFFDSFIIMTVLTTITWVYFLEPLLQYETSTFHFILSLTYPAAHLGILIGIVMLFVSYKSTFPPIVLTINTAVVFIYTIAEFYYLYRAIYDNYNYLSLITPVWNICVILIGLSSFYGSHIDVQSPQEEKNQPKKVHSIFIIIPYLSLMLLVILAIIKKEAILGIFIGGMVVLFFIVIRQVITIFENRTLVRQLKGRTEELERLQIEQLELKEAADEQSWLKTRIAEIATMYSGIDNIETLARQLINKITPMVRATYAVIYVKDDKGILQKLAAYADTRQEDIGASSFHLGEGIVGQCALENRIIVLNRIPKDYIKITSGLGSKQPSRVTVIPAEFQGEVLAVIELASFQSFSHLEEMLLQEVVSNLGINIQSILGQMQVRKLLQESQALTEESQSQSEELQLQQEELRTINEQLGEQYESSEQKSKELEKVQSILEEKVQQLERLHLSGQKN